MGEARQGLAAGVERLTAGGFAVGRLAPEGQRAIEGQKYQPTGAEAEKGAKGPTVGPKRGSNVRTPSFFGRVPALPAGQIQPFGREPLYGNHPGLYTGSCYDNSVTALFGP